MEVDRSPTEAEGGVLNFDFVVVTTGLWPRRKVRPLRTTEGLSWGGGGKSMSGGGAGAGGSDDGDGGVLNSHKLCKMEFESHPNSSLD